MRDYGSFEQVCALLGMSEVACLHLASGSFEDIKKKFVGPGGRAVDISVVGEEGALMERWTVRMTRFDARHLVQDISSADST